MVQIHLQDPSPPGPAGGLVQSLLKPLNRGVPINGWTPNVYDVLTAILPLTTPHSKFWWNKLGQPFARMLETANYTAQVQCRFLCFVFHSVIRLLEPRHSTSKSMMTLDGSPVELSWVMPKSIQPDEPGSMSSSAKRRKHRQVRFAIEPVDPSSGRRLRGSAVLDYLVSPQGCGEVVQSVAGDMEWSHMTESFLFGGEDFSDEQYITDGSRFFVGFDFMSNGTVSLKAYYLPAPSPTSELSLSHRSGPSRRLCLWDTDYEPLRRLVLQLEPGMMEPLDVLLTYFGTVDDDYKPRVQIASVDCVKSNKNRLKLYFRPKRGSSWSDVVRSMTLGGRLQSTDVDESLEALRKLWDSLFPQVSSDMHVDLVPRDRVATATGSSHSNGIPLNEADHPVEGLLYYYSLFPGETNVFPKIYLPVSRYCDSDLSIARSIEQFHTGSCEAGWNERDVSYAMSHRLLEDGAGVHTYVTFGLKKTGWEVTTYFSPEVYRV